jgi:cell division inhibitor SepF
LSQLESVWPRSVHAEYEEWSSISKRHETPLHEDWNPPRRMYIVDATSFDEGAQAVADRFKRHQPVILNLQGADEDLSERMVDFCAGLTYALDGRMQPIVDGLFLLMPYEVEVSSDEEPRRAERVFFNRL